MPVGKWWLKSHDFGYLTVESDGMGSEDRITFQHRSMEVRRWRKRTRKRFPLQSGIISDAVLSRAILGGSPLLRSQSRF